VLLLHLALMTMPTMARAVDRATAASTVINDVILLHPEAYQMSAFGPQSTVPAGTLVQDGFEGRDAAIAPTTSWLFWLDAYPEGKFGHTTYLVLVDESTGSIVLQTEMRFWPRIGGVDLYRDSDVRGPLHPDLIYEGAEAFTSHAPGTWVRELGLLVVPEGTEPVEGAVALIISGSGTAGNADEKADVDSAKAVLQGVMGVPADKITTVDNKDAADVGAAIAGMPKKAPKVFVYVTAHGLPGRFFTGKDSIKAEELASQLKALEATEYCIVMAQCYSGSFLDAFRDSGLAGTHMSSASADTTAWARKHLSIKFPWRGEIFTHYWAHCLRAGQRGTAAYECARDSVTAYVARRHKTDPAPHDPKPKSSVVFRDTTSGQSTTFKVPAGSGAVRIAWRPGPASACGNVSLYAEIVNGVDTTWRLVRFWNWNLGQTRSFNPAIPGGTGRYRLVSHANGYPDVGEVRFHDDPEPQSPSSQPTFAAGSVGWRDHDDSELPLLPFAGSNVYAPGLTLSNVPGHVGVLNSDFVPLVLNMPFFADPSRPWLYVGGNPSLGINGMVTVEAPATRISDPFGQPVPQLQMQLDFQQGPDFRSFTLQYVDTGDGIVSPTVALGPMLPQPFSLVLRAPSGAAALGPGIGHVTLDAFIVNMTTSGTVDAPTRTAEPGLALSQASPNPFIGGTQVRLMLAAPQRVRAAVVDITGRRIRTLVDGLHESGQHSLAWDGRDDGHVATGSGIYFLLVETEEWRASRKLVRMQ